MKDQDKKYSYEEMVDFPELHQAPIPKLVEMSAGDGEPEAPIPEKERCGCGVLLSEHGSGANGYCTGAREIEGAIGEGGVPVEGWEEELGNIGDKYLTDGVTRIIRDFIRQTLLSERQALVERCEGMKLDLPRLYVKGEAGAYKQACDDIIKIIQEKK